MLLKMFLKIISPILCLVVLFQLTAGKLKCVCTTAIRNLKILVFVIATMAQLMGLFKIFGTKRLQNKVTQKCMDIALGLQVVYYQLCYWPTAVSKQLSLVFCLINV